MIRRISLLIAPEGIEITKEEKNASAGLLLLIAPEGIEISELTLFDTDYITF